MVELEQEEYVEFQVTSGLDGAPRNVPAPGRDPEVRTRIPLGFRGGG